MDVGLKTLRRLYRFSRRPRRWCYPSHIETERRGNQALQNALEGGEAFLAGRFGSVELNCLERFHRIPSPIKRYSAKLKRDMSLNAGFFPTDDESLDAFAEEYGNATADLDILGVWYNPYEDLVVRELCPRARLVPLHSLEPYYFDSPWSKALEGKRVLVIHPFAASIEESFHESRARLFENPAVLPLFDLFTLKAVQSNGGAYSGFASWFDALESMKKRMSSLDFDVCIVGAGAYGLPLAHHAKSLGKQAIHMGGASQVLFGIIGRRWEEHDFIKKLINSAWRRPSAAETPPDAHLVENGCYW